MRAAVAAGADLEEKHTPYQITALCIAAMKGHAAVLRVLVELGARLESRSSYGSSAGGRGWGCAGAALVHFKWM